MQGNNINNLYDELNGEYSSERNNYGGNNYWRNLNSTENRNISSQFKENIQRNITTPLNNRNNYDRNVRKNINFNFTNKNLNIESLKSENYYSESHRNNINTFKGNNNGNRNNYFKNDSQFSDNIDSGRTMNYFSDDKIENNSVLRNNNKYYKSSKFYDRKTQKEKIKIDVTKLDQREHLIHDLKLNKYECMICMNFIDKHNATWSCDNCYHLFHLQCITKWANSSDNKDNNDTNTDDFRWRCPACQNQNENIKITKLYYTCFCKKQINPTFKFNTIAHSCGDVCSKTSKSNPKCPHLCSLLCHPGPCPPCEASVTRQCHCKRTRITARCIADDEQFHCESICDKILKCGLHKCIKQCHIDDGHLCDVIIKQRCCCGCSYRNVVCGSEESKVDNYNCDKVCNRMKSCGNHRCELLCHGGKCGQCELIPENVKECFCGKMTLKQLSIIRKSCLDPIPCCKGICSKIFKKCGHTCQDVCHDGHCKPCTGNMKIKCVCQGTLLTVECSSNDASFCKQRCKKKLLCNRHRCDKLCCDLYVHLCPKKCGRMLSCKQHYCDRDCGHLGQCPPCSNVSFDELFCECGTTFSYPPIACGQKAPFCRELCSREHPCNHQIRHNCHTASKCPPCTELVNKFCPGQHTEYFNIPCFQPLVTCGRVCGKVLRNCDHMCLKKCHMGECFEEDETCKQACCKMRKDCEHPCNAPCHEGDCNEFMNACEHDVKVFCKCRLKCVSFNCVKFESFKDDEFLLPQYDLYKVADSDNVEVNCDQVCVTALQLASDFQSTSVYHDNKSKKKVKIDQSLTCFQKCVSTCHNSTTNIAEKACNSTSYLCIQRYYAAYFEEFTRFNINFVMSLEKIFRGFFKLIEAKENEKCVHCFYSISSEKSQFIRRFSSMFKLICLVTRNEDDSNNVIVKVDADNYCCPQNLLSKKIEDKYFKISGLSDLK